MDAKMAMMAMTTNNSIRVKPAARWPDGGQGFWLSVFILAFRLVFKTDPPTDVTLTRLEGE
jgi:hypothetical protein